MVGFWVDGELYVATAGFECLDHLLKISSIKFSNFKALSDDSVSLQGMNILVRPNNCGKSTIISAFRILDVALRKACSRKAERVPIPFGSLRKKRQSMIFSKE